MHDVLDIIKNVQSLYAVGPTLGILKDFERVLDDLDIYVFQNWEDGELLSGPTDSRHFVTCSFMWPADKMPDPAGGKRLLDRGCKVTYKKDELLKPREIKTPADYRPGTRKGKIDAILISSKELSQKERDEISQEISKAIKSNIDFAFKTDKSLISGTKIQVGSLLIDTSLSNKLKRLKQSMLEG